MTVLFAFASEQEMVFLLATRAGHVLQIARRVRVRWKQGGAPVHGHALAAVDGGSVARLASLPQDLLWNVPDGVIGEVHASCAGLAGGDDPERHTVFERSSVLAVYVLHVVSADDLVSGSHVEPIAQLEQFVRVAFAFALRAPFEDEPFVDVAYLRVRSGDQQCRLAHRLPFDAHLVRVFLHVRVLAPVDAVMRQIFVHELPALVDARFVQPVAAVA